MELPAAVQRRALVHVYCEESEEKVGLGRQFTI